MPRYHFSVYDGVDIQDREGTDLPNLQSARQEAIRFAGEIIADEGRSLSFGEDWRMEVTDTSGLLLFRLDFMITSSAAATVAMTRIRGGSGTTQATMSS